MAQLGSSKVFGNLQVTGNIVAGTTITGTTLSISGTATAVTFSGALSGNATTATTLQTARTINETSFNGSASITLNQLYRHDDRTISPSEITAGYMRYGFGAWNNNGVSPFADYLHLRSYTDSSGGNDNLVMFRKDAIGLRLYQQSYGSTTAYSSYRDVAFTDSPTFTGQVVVAAGTSAAPAITTTGDLNTGMFFPAADTIALTEGGVEVLRITSGASVGIGTTAPTAKLEVIGGASLSGTLTFNGSVGSSGQVLTSQGSSAPIWTTISGGSGTVTSAAMTVPNILSVSGSPVTSSGTFALSLSNQNANLIFAGPATGAATTPTFRSLTSADIPNLGSSYLPMSGGTITGDVYVNGLLNGKYIRPYFYTDNISIGMSALNSLTYGSSADSNIGVGTNSLNLLTAGTGNIGIGTDALKLLTAGTGNIAIGASTLSNADNINGNIAVGNQALFNNLGEGNNAFGNYALTGNTSGQYNVAMGANALTLNNGDNNIGIGFNPGVNLLNGNFNIFIGDSSGGLLDSNESNNTFIGGYAGTPGINNTVALSAGTTLRFQVDTTGAYINGSTYAVLSTNGGTFSGAIAGITPINADHLATKAYVDANSGGGSPDALTIAWLGL